MNVRELMLSTNLIPTIGTATDVTCNLNAINTLLQMVYPVSTLTAYKNDQKTFMEIVGKDLLHANTLDVLNYIKSLRSKGYATSTISRKIYSISSQLEFLVIVGSRADNPIKALQKIKKNLIPKQVVRIQQTLEKADITLVKKLQGNKTALLIELLYSTGGRISEILSIKTENIKPHDATVSTVEILGKGNKSRTLFISNNLIERIQQASLVKSEYLIHTEKGNQASQANEYKKIRALIKKIAGKQAHPHQLRHLYATTQIVDNKQDIKAVSMYLGHSTTAITLDMYVDARLSSKQACL